MRRERPLRVGAHEVAASVVPATAEVPVEVAAGPLAANPEAEEGALTRASRRRIVESPQCSATYPSSMSQRPLLRGVDQAPNACVHIGAVPAARPVIMAFAFRPP